MTIFDTAVGDAGSPNSKSSIGEFFSSRGITQSRVADVIGKSQASVSRRLNRNCSEDFRLSELQKIVNAEGISIVITPSWEAQA